MLSDGLVPAALPRNRVPLPACVGATQISWVAGLQGRNAGTVPALMLATISSLVLAVQSRRRLRVSTRAALRKHQFSGCCASTTPCAALCASVTRPSVRARVATFPFAGSAQTNQSSAVQMAALPPLRSGEEVRTIQGIVHRRLGSSEVVVSECGLGTQRWASADFNGPNEALCHKMMDRAILEGGVNLVDTAEQYPIPSGPGRQEGVTEQVIGRWIAKDRTRREKLVVATKITGGLNVNARNIRKDLEGSLKRLQTDYVDVYLTHWSFRISQPQQNWGQSLQYRQDGEAYARKNGQATFEEVAQTMDKLFREGKIKGWGCCNESPYGATRLTATAKLMGLEPPCCFQNDFSLVNRRCEENGLFEMSSPFNEGVGFMAYNVLAGGVLSGKYLDEPAVPDNSNPIQQAQFSMSPRGRMDDAAWGRTLYRYRSAPAAEATRAYAKLAAEAGVSITELALRWARQRDGLTTALVGHTSLAQLDETMRAFQNPEPLPGRLMWEVDRVHMRNRLPIFASLRVGEGFGARAGAGEIGEPVP